VRSRVLSILLIVMISLWAGEYSGWATTADTLTPAGSTNMPFNLVDGTFAVWSGGMFVFVQDRCSGAPFFRFFDRNGTQVSEFSFSIPGASLINIYDHSVAVGLDGSLAIVGTAYTDDSRGGAYLAWVSPDRKQQTIIRTSPFWPQTVTLASDGTIWVAGYEPSQQHEYDYSHHLIRRYDKAGKLLGSFIPWSTFGTAPRPVPAHHSILLSLKDRVGWYSPVSHTYIEFSLDGSVINQFKSAPHPKNDLTYVTSCDDGSLFASTQIYDSSGAQTNWGIFTLDRQRGAWSFIPRNERWGMLFGCDGTRLASATDFKTISWLDATVK
jgi:hypothetical protein